MPRSGVRKWLAALTLAVALGLGATSCTPLEPRPRSITAADRSGAGAHHVVERGETLWRISKAYGVSVTEIKEANGLRDSTILVGQKLFIPGATRAARVPPAAAPADEGGGDEAAGTALVWPLAGRNKASVRSRFGPRADPINGAAAFHQGIDIEAARDERVLAAANGEVVFASDMSGYGTVVMLDHGGRTITLYAHLSRAVVHLEDVVSLGQTVGYVGSDGRATGPHLHFEVRVKGVPVDPLDHLP
jgi:murein DD-endopeptidase MepM/ murein hydrolase activator NlpD